MPKRILITGGSGFIGTELAKELVQENEVHVMDIKTGKVNNVFYHILDLTNKEQTKNLIQKLNPSIIYHLAGKIRGTKEELHSTNINTTKNILESYNGRIVFMSTGMVYQGEQAPYSEETPTEPIDEYPKTKKICEELLKGRENTAIVRASVVYGPTQESLMFISSLKQYLIERKGFFQMTKGEQKRDFLHVQDLVQALIILQSHHTGIFNIASGESISLKEVIKLTKEMTGDFPIDESLPYRENEMWEYLLKREKAKKELGWEPKISFQEGLKNTIQDKTI